jgi:hypothetical protein
MATVEKSLGFEFGGGVTAAGAFMATVEKSLGFEFGGGVTAAGAFMATVEKSLGFESGGGENDGRLTPIGVVGAAGCP